MTKCTGRKLVFATRDDALAKANRAKPGRLPALRAYRCKPCKGWHLTKQRTQPQEATP